MKRNFLEISDDEWENHTFKPSRVLGTSNPPPPIENFAYTSAKTSNSNQSSGDSVEITGSYQVNREENLEDDDFDEGVRNVSKQASRGRRFIVDDDDSDDDFVAEGGNGLADVVQVNSSEEGYDEDKDSIFDEDEVEEDDVIGKALQKCAKISAELRKELYGSSVTTCDRYAEVDASSVRIVNQDDVLAACGEEDSDFQPLLKPYQLVGVNFLLLHYRKKIGGAILADEMGLGKTIQAITYLTLLNHLEDDPGPHLVVCPASLLENWEREFKKWCPSFSVLQYHGTARLTYSKELSSLAKSGLPSPFNVILVCYSLFERHSVQQKDDRKILKRWKWSCVLMDEAHALKDKNSYRWKNLMSVARNAKQRLMLTGTPLQNDLHELWSLLEFMMPDIFETGDVDLKKLLTSEDRDLISRMKSILGPFILRRLKSDVMGQLSPKTQQVEYVEMTKQQQDAYNEAIEEYRTASQARLKLSGDKSALGILPKRQISNYFLQFRKIANHPLLVRRIYTDADVIRIAKRLHSRGVFGFECTSDRVVEELKGYNDFAIHRLLLHNGISDIKGVLSDEHVLTSAKCETLAKLLPQLHKKGHRVLIFSQWTSMLDILEWALDVIGFNYRRLDGSTQVTERQNIVDTFNKNTSIFACLLSTRAGGQGLNLVGADTVIIHDMDFNPQIDRQAEDRCHRIGQTKPVTIYRLVTKESVDENIYEIAKRKLVLDAAVLETGIEVENEGEPADKTMGEILSSLLLG
ncbi:protein CHROMATIN REMODELING 19 isoform X1 [Impatiens glandulifera]|uniref:protein CHROMATIN REMODELING 19 isoform X1 n=1 Tax=Impatiens glandulifera TaxID=253017 RepID=UPI001FB07938|nr:protein CHROMATIN REMODELING 19 isoform X1 [Impatiens glandulifera]